MKNYNLFLDDIRIPENCMEYIGLVSFDHDLRDEHYHPSMYEGVQAYENAYKAFEHPTGRRSAEFLVKFCKENNVPLPECLVHTMNPAGKDRIRNTISKR